MPETRYLNTVRVLALAGVIMGHIFITICAYFAPVLTPIEQYSCTVLRNLWYWCIPLFVMISGVLFLDPYKDISLKKLFGKYILRIILALCVFGIPYSFAELLVSSGYRFTIRQTGAAVLHILRGTAQNHLWYLYMIIGLYLVIPILKGFVSYIERKGLEYMLIVLFIFTSIMPFLKTIFAFKTGFYIPVDSVYVFYLLTGHYIHHYNIKIHTGILIGIILMYVVYVTIMPINSGMIVPESNGSILSLEPESPFVALISLALFCLFHQKNIKNNLADFLSPLCFGIYLIHPLFLFSQYLFLQFTPAKYPLFLFIPVSLISIIAASIGFTCIGRKIPLMRKYLL